MDDYDLDDLEGVLKNLALEDDFEEGEEEEGEGGRFDYDGEEDRRREEVGSIGGGSEKYSGMTQSRVYGHCFVHGKGNRGFFSFIYFSIIFNFKIFNFLHSPSSNSSLSQQLSFFCPMKRMVLCKKLQLLE